MSIRFVSIVVGEENNYIHLFYNDNKAFCVDVCDSNVLMKALGIEFTKDVYSGEEILGMEESRKRRDLMYVFTTHRHLDHSAGIPGIKRMIPDARRISGFEGDVCSCGDTFSFDGVEIECIFTPCHTIDSFCYYIDGRYLATGDTLFFLGCGKFFEGSSIQMIQAIERIKERVSHDTILLYGHDYNETNIRFTEGLYDVPGEIKMKRFLSVNEEIEYNPFFNLDKVGIGGDREEVMLRLRDMKNKFK